MSGLDQLFFVTGPKQKNKLWGYSKVILPFCYSKRFLSLQNALSDPVAFLVGSLFLLPVVLVLWLGGAFGSKPHGLSLQS